MSAKEAFAELDMRIPARLHELWAHEEKSALENRVSDPKAMDIFEVQLEKGMGTLRWHHQFDLYVTAPTMKSIEMDIISNELSDSHMRGATTWMARVLKAEESQIILAMDARRMHARATETQRLSIVRRWDHLHTQIDRLCESTAHFLGNDWNEGISDHHISTADMDEEDSENVFEDSFHPHDQGHPNAVTLPLPSYLGLEQAESMGLSTLAYHESWLREGQANNALHELRVALANKAVIFRTDIRKAGTYNMTTRAWGRVASADGKVQQHAAIYRKCRKQMVALNARGNLLDRYKVLKKEDLKVSAAIADPNARGHRDDTLAWFWTMDVPRDTKVNDWMSECMTIPCYLNTD